MDAVWDSCQSLVEDISQTAVVERDILVQCERKRKATMNTLEQTEEMLLSLSLEDTKELEKHLKALLYILLC